MRVQTEHEVNPNNLISTPKEPPTENMVSWNLTILIWTRGCKGGGNHAEKTSPGGYHYIITTIAESQVPGLMMLNLPEIHLATHMLPPLMEVHSSDDWEGGDVGFAMFAFVLCMHMCVHM